MRITTCLALSVLITGCKGKDASGTSAAGPDEINACALSENYCVGFGSDWDADAATAWCDEAGGTQDAKSCPEGAQGTCDVEDEGALTYHFYDTPPADAKGYCEYLAGVWVDPEA